MRMLFIINDPPYGTERVYNALRVAHALVKKDPAFARSHTGVEVELPIAVELQRAIEASPVVGASTFLVTAHGKRSPRTGSVIGSAIAVTRPGYRNAPLTACAKPVLRSPPRTARPSMS